MSMEQWWNDTDRGKPTYSEKNLSQCHFAYVKLVVHIVTTGLYRVQLQCIFVSSFLYLMSWMS